MSIRLAHSLRAAFILILLPAPLSAGIIISEVMYDLPGADQGREWIEIENTGDAPVDIAGWKLFEAGVRHKVSPAGLSLIQPHSFAVIVDDRMAFMGDVPGYSGLLFESSFSLSNSGEMLSLLDASSTPVATTAYSAVLGAAGDGNSLNAVGSEWVTRRPTPGMSVASDAVVPPAKSLPTSKTIARNLSPEPGVIEESASAPRGEPREALLGAAAGAPVPEMEKGSTPGLFAMLPWIGGLLLISVAGTIAVIVGRRTNGSGYRIIEEES